MSKWQSLGALVFLGSVVACATATTGGTPEGSAGGTDASGSTGGDLVGPAGGNGSVTAGTGSTTGGTSSIAGTTSGVGGQTAFGGTASVGGQAAFGGTASTAGASSGGASGAAGAHSGGSSGTSSGGASGGGGTGGATSTGPCANPVDGSKGSYMLGTVAAVCVRTAETFNTIACYNADGRTVKVNGVDAACVSNPVKSTFAPAIGGFNYFEISAGSLAYASIGWYLQ